MAKVPLIDTTPFSEFGDLEQSADFKDPRLMDGDHSYVPGFSDIRREHEAQKAEYYAGLRDRKDVRTVPVNLRWARSQRRNGESDTAKPFSHGRRGYRAVTQKDVGKEWLTAMPPGTQVGADGTIRNGDTILMVCDREQAARNEHAKQVLTQSRIEGAQATFEDNVSKVFRAAGAPIPKGTAPTVEKEIGAPLNGAPKK